MCKLSYCKNAAGIPVYRPFSTTIALKHCCSILHLGGNKMMTGMFQVRPPMSEARKRARSVLAKHGRRLSRL